MKGEGGIIMDYAKAVDRAKVNEASLAAACAKLGVEGTTTEDRIVALSRLFEPMKKVARCTTCGGHSDPNLDACPFCGDGGEVEGFIAPPKEEPKANGAKANGNGAATAVEDRAREPVAEAVPSKPARKPKKEKSAKVSDVQVGPADPAQVAIVKADPTPAATVSDDLDEAVARIKQLEAEGNKFAADSGSRYYQIGKVLAGVHEDQSWKQRMTADGKTPVYRSFDAWCAAEVGWSSTNAYRAIDVAKEYDEETVRKIGISKLSLALSAPKEQRAQIEEKLQAGASYREAEAAVKEAKAKGGTKRETGRKDVSKAVEAAGDKGRTSRLKKLVKASGQTITIASISGTKTIKLFAKGSDEKRAKRLADEPYGVLDLENDVRQTFSIVETDAGLVLKIKTVRGE